MKLRTRITLLVVAAVAVAVAAAAAASFVSAERELRGEVDTFLAARATEAVQISSSLGGRFDTGVRFGRLAPLVAPDAIIQYLTPDGGYVVAIEDAPRLPVDGRDLGVAARSGEALYRTEVVGGESYRMLTAPLPDGGAIQVGRSLEETEAVLAGLRLRLTVVGLLGVALAAALGWIVTTSAMAPVAQLTEAAEHVAETQDLEAPIAVNRNDEVGRLAKSFNTMLSALRRSQEQQHRLVMDASHELRTPLTSLRTNIDYLAKAVDIPPGERGELLDDVRFELEELSSMVAELVDLATDAETSLDPDVTFDLGATVTNVVDRARRRLERPIHVSADEGLVIGQPAMIERAVSNLIGNAHKWSPNAAPIEVSVAAGRVSVRDHGPGIDRTIRPYVFERFFRADEARSMPGSGLGLAIVRKVAISHGGRVFVEEAPDGGAIVGFEVPLVTASDRAVSTPHADS